MIHKLNVADCTSQLFFLGSSTCNLMTRAESMVLLSELRYDLYFLMIKEHLRWHFAK